MRKTIASTAILAGLALGVAMGSSAQADYSTQVPESYPPASMPSSGPTTTPQPTEAPPSNPAEGPQAQPPEAQQPGGQQGEIADATRLLEEAFEKQFEQNLVDQAVLTKAIARVIVAFPEWAQSRVRVHINDVFETGKKLAPQMSPEERTKAINPPEKLGKAQQALLGGWGWNSGLGFGGLGAFGFPGMFASPNTAFFGPTMGLWGGTGFPAFGAGCWNCGWGGLGTAGWGW